MECSMPLTRHLLSRPSVRTAFEETVPGGRWRALELQKVVDAVYATTEKKWEDQAEKKEFKT
ncbi:hypothetical protein ACN28S_30920 [Cystobacter fuscus]